MTGIEQLKKQIEAAFLGDNWDETIELCTLYLEKEEDHLVYIARGAAYRALGKYSEALADMEKAKKMDPKNILAYVTSSTTYHVAGQRDKAIIECDMAIEIAPDFAPAYYQRGALYFAGKKYDKAFADFDKAITLDPNMPGAYYGRGSAYLAQGEAEKSISDFNTAIELDPTHAIFYNLRGAAYNKIEKYDEAIADFHAAIKVDPDDVTAYKNIFSAYANKDKYVGKLEEYEENERLAKERRDNELAELKNFAMYGYSSILVIFMLFSLPSYNMLPYLFGITLALSPLALSVRAAQKEHERYAKKRDDLEKEFVKKEHNVFSAESHTSISSPPMPLMSFSLDNIFGQANRQRSSPTAFFTLFKQVDAEKYEE